MNRALAVIFTFLFLIIASFVFLWLRPVALPEPLKPVGTWFDERKSAMTGEDDNKPESAASAAIAAATGNSEEPKQVDLASSRSSVAQVTVDGQGGSTVRTAQIGDAASSGQPALAAAAASATAAAAGAAAAITAPATDTAAKMNETAQSVVASAAPSAASAIQAARDKVAQGVATTTQTAQAVTAQASSGAADATASASAAESNAATAGTDSSVSASVQTNLEQDADASAANDIRSEDSAAAAATNALAAASARTARRAAALEQVERELGSTNASAALPTQNSRTSDPAATTTTAATNVTDSGDTGANQDQRSDTLAPAVQAGTAFQSTTAQAAVTESSRSGSVVSQPAPVALLKPEVKARRPVTAAAVRQQQTITNYLDGRRVEFEVGRDVLSQRGIRVLDRLVPLIKANRGTLITIQGHTDDVGDYASNLELSGARAIAARKYLISRGIDPRRLKVQGMGERAPIADNNTAAGRIRNRRIDFAVSDAG